MSLIGTLNRADHNNKGSIPCDHGTGLFPLGRLTFTYYSMVARIVRAVKYRYPTAAGKLCRIELEDHPYPPGDPTQTTDETRQNPVGLSEFGVNSSRTGYPDYVSIAGTQNFDGEHAIMALDGMPGYKTDKEFLLVDNVNPANTGVDHIEELNTGWVYIAARSQIGNSLMEPARIMSHPSFTQREGEGIYTYPYPPDITRNFVYHPAIKIDGVVQKTIGSNILIAQPQLPEDVIISEVWLGGDRVLSALTEMFRVFYNYWTTSPPIGDVLGWEPRDRTFNRFGIQLVRVTLGGIDYEYNEVRQYAEQNKHSFLDRQLTVQFKLARRTKPSRSLINLEGR